MQTHEASLKNYLRHSFPAVRDIDDVVQASYLRVWRRQMIRPIAEAAGSVRALSLKRGRASLRRCARIKNSNCCSRRSIERCGNLVASPAVEGFGAQGYLVGGPELEGIFIATRAGIRLGGVRNLDVAPTVAQLLGVPMPSAEGKSLTQIFATEKSK